MKNKTKPSTPNANWYTKSRGHESFNEFCLFFSRIPKSFSLCLCLFHFVHPTVILRPIFFHPQLILVRVFFFSSLLICFLSFGPHSIISCSVFRSMRLNSNGFLFLICIFNGQWLWSLKLFLFSLFCVAGSLYFSCISCLPRFKFEHNYLLASDPFSVWNYYYIINTTASFIALYSPVSITNCLLYYVFVLFAVMLSVIFWYSINNVQITLDMLQAQIFFPSFFRSIFINVSDFVCVCPSVCLFVGFSFFLLFDYELILIYCSLWWCV